MYIKPLTKWDAHPSTVGTTVTNYKSGSHPIYEW